MNDELTGYFNEVEDFHWWWQGRRILLAEAIRKSGGKKSRQKILDVGCGTGGDLKFLSQFGQTWGIDTSKTAVGISRKKGWKNVTLAKATKLDFADRTFDMIFFLDVLEHIENDKKALIEAARVLKPGGRIIVTVPSGNWMWSEHDSMQGHYRRYGGNELKGKAEEAGLVSREIRYFNVWLLPLIATIRILSRYNGFKKLGKYDSKLNFDISKIKWMNDLLIGIFRAEIESGKWVKYPIGVSVLGVFEKPNMRRGGDSNPR